MGILYRTRFYLIGAIESVEDGGKGWRNQIKESLKDTEIVWLDPCDKPFIEEVVDLNAGAEARNYFDELKATRQYDKVSSIFRRLRIYDLSLVDKSDAVIYYIDNDVQSCGSWEEVFWSNRLKRPVFVICKQGKDEVPYWLYGTLPHKYFYNSVDEVCQMIHQIDSGQKKIDSDRWRLLKIELR